jgi:hypothetical protein
MVLLKPRCKSIWSSAVASPALLQLACSSRSYALGGAALGTIDGYDVARIYERGRVAMALVPVRFGLLYATPATCFTDARAEPRTYMMVIYRS